MTRKLSDLHVKKDAEIKKAQPVTKPISHVHQFEFTYRKHGGKRLGAGRPRSKSSHPRHQVRAEINGRTPVHVTLRLRRGLPGLRQKRVLKVARQALLGIASRQDFGVVLWSLQGNHIHLMAEGKDRESFGKGMGALCSRLARGLNRLWGRTGKVFAGRYHGEALQSPRQVRNAIPYILGNFRKHARQRGQVVPKGVMDEFSSWAWFQGWDWLPAAIQLKRSLHRQGPAPCSPPRTWLLRVGWQRHGLIGPWEAPKSV